jgi:cytochrome c oxidase subunit 1
MDAMTYNRMFTLHGVTMVWMFLIPSIPTVFGNFVLPIQLGAKDLAFPKMNLVSLYMFWLGLATTLGGMLAGGTDTGWTFYPPYSDITPTRLVPVLMGIFILGISTILTGINFVATTHMLRAKGIRWSRIPLFVWTIYGTSIIMLLATPVLGMSLLLVGLDNGLKLGIFDPSVGGDPVLFEHIFWFYSHPAVYIMILPAMGVISEVVPSFAHRRPASYTAIAISTLGIAFVGFFTWATTCSWRASRPTTRASLASSPCSWPSSRPSRSSPGPRPSTRGTSCSARLSSTSSLFCSCSCLVG